MCLSRLMQCASTVLCVCLETYRKYKCIYCHQFIFILYTNECQSFEDNCHVVKYADDTVFLIFLSSSKGDDSHAFL